MVSVHSRLAPGRGERGIVLAAAVLFVLLTSVLVMTFMTTTTGERTQSSNVQTAKMSLYAADAGVRTQQQILANIGQAKIDSCVTAWNNAGCVGAIVTNPQNLFPAGTLGGTGAASATNPPFNASASISFADSDCTPQSQVYNYLFSISSTGTVRTTGRRSVQSQGMLRVSATRGTFADYLLFMNTFTMNDGSTIWLTSSGSFDGRVHTNTGFKFAFKPTFQDEVTQHNSNATFYNNGSPVSLNANNNGTIDVPNFFGGYLRSQTVVPMPTNSFNQQAASLGITGLPAGTPPTNNQINTALFGTSSGSAPPNGIYLPRDGSNQLTGGIYIQGTVDKVKMWADTLANRQYYQFTQGSTYQTVEVDHALGTTKVWNNLTGLGTPTLYTNTPPNGVLYGTNAITNLTGPDRTPSTGHVNPAIAENTTLLVAAAGDITIQGDITCDSFNNKNNVLGIFSSGGSVHIGNSAPTNVNIDAFVMASGTTGQFAVDNFNSGSPRGSVNLRGGVVASYYGAFGTFNSSGAMATGYSRSFHYDRRGLIPPFYPTTTRFDSDRPSARTMAWKEI
jgi:Tfp pilus assembly protein PilX